MQTFWQCSSGQGSNLSSCFECSHLQKADTNKKEGAKWLTEWAKFCHIINQTQEKDFLTLSTVVRKVANCCK